MKKTIIQNKKSLISIIAPMYNEDRLVDVFLEKVFQALQVTKDKYLLEIVLVNDGSTDNTFEAMKMQQLKYPDTISIVSLSRNFGLEGAVHAGLKAARGNLIVVMDADLQDPPETILEMLAEIENGAQVVTAVRHTRESDSAFKRGTASLFYKIMDCLSGKVKIQQNAANFKMFTWEVLEVLLTLPEINSVFRVSVPYVGFKTATITYSRDKRYAGTTKYSLKNMLPYALDSITSLSITPLRMLWCLPLLGGVFSFVFIFLSMCVRQYWSVFLIVATMAMFSTLILLAIGVIAEYLAKVVIETRKRPISIVQEYIPARVKQEEIE